MGQDLLAGPGRAVAEGALTWLGQSSALLVLGLAAGRLVRRAGPAVESAVARTTLAAVLLCPVATVVSGQMGWTGWSVRLPVVPSEAPDIEPVGPVAVRPDPAIEPAPDRAALAPVGPRPVAPSVGVGPDRPAEAPGPMVADRAGSAVDPAPVPAPGRGGGGRAWASALIGAGLLAWGAGTLILLGRLGASVRALRRVRRASVPAGSGAVATCRDLAGRLGLAAPEVRVAPLLGGPCLAGWPRPSIFLPDDAPDLDGVAEVSPELRDAILHELAHLARRDLAWNWLRHVATALLWPQPLAWALGRRIESTAEEVADDFVVQAGADRAGYASLLLRVALRGVPPAAAPGVGMVALRSMLARRVVRIMDRSRRPSVAAGRRALASILLLGAAGTALAGLLGVAAERGSTRASADPVAVARKEDSPPPGAIRGQVVGPDGTPVPGATVVALVGDGFEPAGGVPGRVRPRRRVVRAIAEPDGRFVLDVDPSRVAAAVARAPGLGMGIYRRDRPEIRLAADDRPIRGRVVDLEGRPVAGARVRLLRASLVDDPARLREADARPGPWEYPVEGRQAVEGEAVLAGDLATDADGRFALDGLGRDVLAELEITGPGLALQRVQVVARPMPRAVPPPEPKPEGPLVFSMTAVQVMTSDGKVLASAAGFEQPGVYGADATIVVPNDGPIEGTVRDDATGEPVAGATVTLARVGESGRDVEGQVWAATDASGRYRLAGAPRIEGRTVSVYPPTDQVPYLAEWSLPVADRPGVAAARCDLAVRRGAWVEGRVFDRRTGAPVASTVEYSPLRDNPAAADRSLFDPRNSFGARTRARADAGGRFRVVALPGPGLVAARSDDRAYRVAVGVEGVAGIGERGELPTRAMALAADYQAVRPVDVPAGAGSAACDLPLDPGGTVTLRLVDEAGRPVVGAWAIGRGVDGPDDDDPDPARRNVARVGGLEPGLARTIEVRHRDRRLGAVVEIAADAPSDGPERVVVLRPLVAATGRLVHLKPGTGASLRGVLRHADPARPDEGSRIEGAATDEAGRFRLDTLTPGGMYDLKAEDAGPTGSDSMRPRSFMQSFAAFPLAEGLRVEAGAAIDLGTFDATTGRRVEAPAEPPRADEVRGRVVGPDGLPVPGASVTADVVEGMDEEPGFQRPQVRWGAARRTTADADGRFALAVDLERVGGIVAMAPGFGLGYYHRDQSTIRLTAGDEPIRGRVVDLEGRGVRAHVRLDRVQVLTDPAAGRKAAEAPGPYEFPAGSGSAIGLSGEAALPGGVDTDADGRFTISGLGRDARADLEITGPGIARQEVTVVTRPMARAVPAHELAGHSGSRQAGAYGSSPTIVVPADRPIEGVVRDEATGEPIAGATVTLAQIGGDNLSIEGEIRTRTDAQGRYRLLGVPRGDGPKLSVYPPLDRPYFVERRREVPAQPGAGPLRFDVALKRGAWVAGRVFDRKTGQPKQASVDYFPMLDNPAARDHSTFDPETAASVEIKTRYRTDAEGRFRVVALPGRGVVVARADERAYRVGVGAEGIAGRNDQGQLPTYNHIYAQMYQAIRPVDVPGGAESVACDLPLDPGGSVTLEPVDEAGAPVVGAAASGQGPDGADAGDDRLGDRSRVVIGGLEPGQPRTVLIQHRDRRLGAVVEIPADAPRDGGVRRVVLRPLATATGRLANLPPGVGGVVQGSIRKAGAGDFFRTHVLVTAFTEADGRFRLDGLPVGGAFAVEARDRAAMSDPGGMRAKGFRAFALADGLRVEAGQAVDLGTFDAMTGKRADPPADKPTAQVAPAAAPTSAKPADVAIRGRLVDLEGRPAPGVRVAVRSRLNPKGGDLGPYLDRLRAGEPTHIASRGGEFFADRDYDVKDGPSTTTDAEGRFRLDGFRPESFVGLLIDGGGVAQDRIHVAARAMGPFPAPGMANNYGPGSETIYGAEFTRTVAPGRPIAGVVRDAATGAPLAGVEVQSQQFAGSTFTAIRTLRTRTDAEGRYRIDGMPKGKGNKILLVPTDDQPYLMQEVPVPDSPGLAPLTLDIPLHRGIMVEGTLADAASGRPIPGARIYYHPFLDNPFAQANPAFGRGPGGGGSTYQDRYLTRADGSFRVVALPGRGIVSAQVLDGNQYADYLQGAGSEGIAGIDKNGHFPTYQNPITPSRVWPTVLAGIDPPADAAGPIRVALQAKTGLGVRFRVVDLAGAPVACTQVRGRTSRGSAEWASRKAIPAEGTASNLRPDEERTVLFLQADRKIGRVARFRLGDDKDGPVTVRLEPLATIRGRITDRDGAPIAAARISPTLLPGGDFSIRLGEVASDEAGRFTVAEVPIGCEYALYADFADRTGGRQFASTKDPVAVRPGATTDGVEIRDKDDTQAKRPAEAPAGKPAAPAPAPAAVMPATPARPADVAIRGRLVDLEGRPAAGVRVAVHSRWSPPSGDLGPILDQLRAGAPFSVAGRQGKVSGEGGPLPEGPPVATTDADGRFRLDGIRPESLVGLLIDGGGVAQEEIQVATRAMVPVSAPGWDNQHGPGSETIYGAEFTRTVAPGRPIEGVVRDAATGSPLGGVEIESNWFAGANWVGIRTLRTRTDAEGRYRLDGMPKGPGNQLLIVPTDDQPYPMRVVAVPDGPGLAPVALDVPLRRGIVIEGTLADAATGRAIPDARISYHPFLDNPLAEADPVFRDHWGGSSHPDRYRTRPDGSFRVVGLSGRGIVGAEILDGGQLGDYLQGAGSEGIAGIDDRGNFPAFMNPHAPGREWPTVMAEVDPPADATGPVWVSLRARAGPGVRFRVVDLSGAPVACTEVRGRSSQLSGEYAGRQSIGAEGMVSNLRSDEERTVLFRHDGRQIGRVARFRLGDDRDGPVMVRLEPLATVAGRVFDRANTPIPAVRVRACLWSGKGTTLCLPDVVSDGSGRFAVGGVPVGCDYALMATWKDRDGEAQFATRRLGTAVAVRAGATTDNIELHHRAP